MHLNFYSIYQSVLNSNLSNDIARPKLHRIFETILDKALVDESIQFTSLFAKLSYLSEKYDFSGLFRFELHQLRKLIDNKTKENEDQIFHLLKFLIPHLCQKCFGMKIPQEVRKIMPAESGVTFRKREISRFIPSVKFYCISIDQVNGVLEGFSSDDATEKVIVDYKLQDRNIQFADGINRIKTLPVLMQLIEVEVSMDRVFRPSIIIVEPDFLLDSTAIAGCFNSRDKSLISYILKKFLPMSRSKALLLGNMANHFLDRLIHEPKLAFNDILPELFANDPLGFTVLKDTEVKGFVSDLKQHFTHIQHTVSHTFKDSGIDIDKVYLEPSFISPTYGIQGRLDLLQPHASQPKIVELKSGGIYQPNAYGVNSPHYIQTLMYDLLIRSTFNRVEPKNYILYSKEKESIARAK